MKRSQDTDIFTDIFCRFLLNLPKTERTADRLYYHYQKAYYFYVDHIRPNDRGQDIKLDKLSTFVQHMNNVAPIESMKVNPQQIEKEMSKAINNIPVYGVIMINEKWNKAVCIGVNNKLSFPKGKADEGETPTDTAVRQCWQETGVDVSNRINPLQKIDISNEGKIVCLFLVFDVDQRTTRFNPQTTTQVDFVDWIPIDSYTNQKLNMVSRIAFQKLTAYIEEKKKQKTKFESFIQSFKINWNNPNIEIPKENPFLTFKLDKKALLSAFDS